MTFQVVITDIQRSIDTENEVDGNDRLRIHVDQCQRSTGFSFRNFQREITIKRYIKCLADRYPEKAQLIKIGNSYEGRDLFVIKIGTPTRGIRKPAVWIDGGIHARDITLTFTHQEVKGGGTPGPSVDRGRGIKSKQ